MTAAGIASELVSLLDALPQVTGAGSTWETTHLALDEPAASAARRPGGALAAWLLVLDRLRGDARVGLSLHGGWLELSVPADGTVGAWVERVRAVRPSALRAPRADAELAWVETFVPAEASSPSSSLWLIVGLSPDRTQLVASYRSPPLDASVTRLLLRAWQEVLSRLAVDDAMPLREVSAVSSQEREDLLRSLHAAPWSYAGPMSVPACFRRVARRHAERAAVVWSGGQWTYSELDERSLQISTSLLKNGVRPGELVAVALQRSPQSIAAILGILRAGAAYLPIDPTYPAARLRFMFADASVRVLIAGDLDAAVIPEGVHCLDPDESPAVGAVDLAEPDGEALAYVMYTSGSTGTPKGVEIRHRSIVRLVCNAEFMSLHDGVVMLHAAPLGFDASTLEIWGPLLNGGTCVLHDEDVPTGPGLAGSIARHRVEAAWLTAALFNAVVDDDPRHLSGLRELLIGGEALSLPHVRRFLEAAPGTALINGYGPTETTTFATTHRIDMAALAGARSVPIGRPITRTSLYILNRRGEPIPQGFVGELYIGGLGVGRGYLARPELTAQRFLPDPFAPDHGTMYRTGDLVRCLPDGTVEFVGRADGQVKIRGFRIETGEIEGVLATHDSVQACAVIARKDPDRGAELVAYVVSSRDVFAPAVLRDHLATSLPEFMVPALWVQLDALPVTANGKLDRRALPAPTRERPDQLRQRYVAPRAGMEQEVARVFARSLGIDRVGALDNFFDLGGNSLLILKAIAELRAAGHGSLAVATMFADPTPRSIARSLSDVGPTHAARRQGGTAMLAVAEPIAIIGMAGRFPGAPDIESFWQLLDEGREAIRFFEPEELDASIPAKLRADPAYVRARGVLEGVELFDAGFFGISPKEAELMDPQQRVFLELCWQCLEHAGQVPEKTADTIGVFAGMYNASYYQHHVLAHRDKIERLGEFQVMLANEKDYIATRTAHKLDLTGPAVSVHTACSTSLVAIAQAFDALRARHCGLALAGGASITCPPNSGYLYQEGAMLSPDGHTRSFDAEAQGTVFSDGAAVVLLKRLSDAVADGNTIHAVIRSVAVNNDGAIKASFTAPSVEGQCAVIRAALDRAGIDARSVSYVEAHGTATPLGDPVEVAALTQAFRHDTAAEGFCTIGSVKSNTGHMVIAAGAAGVIKTALALTLEKLPGTVHFRSANPKIAFAGSPFAVRAESSPWRRGALPRRAGVSSFGVGGTNAHVVLEEAPEPLPSARGEGPQLLRVSARSRSALHAAIDRLADHLERHRELDLADVAHTLDVGRREFAERTFVVAATIDEAVAALRSADGARTRARTLPSAELRPVLLFPGQTAQYKGMGSDLYARSPIFREALDECFAALDGHVPFRLRDLMFRAEPAALAQTAVTQPATFALEYALARVWLARGLQPAAMIGHSIGEYVAATLAGVMPLRDAMRLVARRGALMQALPAGAMLSVRLASADLEPLLQAGVQLAADNAPAACVVAGEPSAVATFADTLARRGVMVRALQTSHAFHSAMMDPVIPEFGASLQSLTLSAPSLPIISTVTGTWLTDEQATDVAYWTRHLRDPVRFSSALRTALAEVDSPMFLESGPRAALSTLVRQHRSSTGAPLAVASLIDDATREYQTLTEAAGQLWTAGVDVVWPASPETSRRRVVLPSYAFDRERHWVDAAPIDQPSSSPSASEQPSSSRPSPVDLNSSAEAFMTATALQTNRHASLVARLRSTFEEVSGFELADADSASNFVELGLDSLTLTQVALQLKKEFALPITFRQLMESYSSFDALAEFLAAKLPAEAVPAQTEATAESRPTAPAMPSMPAMTIANYQTPPQDAPFVQQVIQQQMQLMAQQLALLRGQPPATLATSSAAVPDSTAVAAVATPAARPALAAVASPPTSSADDEAALTHRTYDVKKAFGAIARIHTVRTEMTERQRARLDAFMRRYVEKTRRSKAYTVEHRLHLADPRVVNGFRPQLKEIIYQIVIDRSKGSRMWDLDGNEYVDALNGFGMSLFGWQPEFVLDAVRKQLDSGFDIGPQHPLAGEVARLACKLTGFDRVGLCNTGSEAVMGCVRIARTVTGRSKIAIFGGAYHGIFDEVIVRGTKKRKAVPAAPGIMPNTAENVVVLDYGTPDSLQWLKEHAEELAAVLVEPVQSRRPDFQPRDFLAELRVLTEKAGSLLIFDEVVTGFRCHPGGIQALFGIRADLASYGKVVGGGFPIGVIAGKRAYMDALDGGHWQYGDSSIPTVGVTYFAGTFVRHPLALAAAKAVLEHLERQGPDLQAGLMRRTAAMVDELNSYCREVGAPIALKSFSSVWKVFFDEDHPLQDLLFAMMRNRGVHILDNFPCFMTTAHTAEDIAVIKNAFKEAVAELQEADFLPKTTARVTSFDAARPPRPGARLGRDASGNPAWFVANPEAPGKYMKVEVQ